MGVKQYSSSSSSGGGTASTNAGAISIPIEGAPIINSYLIGSTAGANCPAFPDTRTLSKIILNLRDLPTGASSNFTVTVNNVTQATSTTVSIAGNATTPFTTNSSPGISFLNTDKWNMQVTALGSVFGGGTGSIQLI
jgi:hypothetical protein